MKIRSETDEAPPQGGSKIVSDSWERIKVICLLFLSFVALMVVLQATRDILVPFVIAVFFYFAVSPIAKWLRNALHLRCYLHALVERQGIGCILHRGGAKAV